MAGQRKGNRLNLKVGDVVSWGEAMTLGEILEIRIIDTASFVQAFTGEEDAVAVRIRTTLGTALICPEGQGLEKVGDHDAKAFKLELHRRTPAPKSVTHEDSSRET